MFSPCGLSVRFGGQVWKGYFIPLFSSWGILGRLRVYLSCEEVLPKLSSSARVLGAVWELCVLVCVISAPPRWHRYSRESSWVPAFLPSGGSSAVPFALVS